MTIQPPHATLYEEGREAEDGNDYGTASAKFQAAAALGDTRAQTRLVGVWAIGRAPESDYSEAVDWYREFSVIADINGGRQWETNLGDVYFLGLGVPQDDSEAVHAGGMPQTCMVWRGRVAWVPHHRPPPPARRPTAS